MCTQDVAQKCLCRSQDLCFPMCLVLNSHAVLPFVPVLPFTVVVHREIDNEQVGRCANLAVRVLEDVW